MQRPAMGNPLAEQGRSNDWVTARGLAVARVAAQIVSGEAAEAQRLIGL